MHRSIFQPFRTLAALAIAVGAIACADRTEPTGPAALDVDGAGDTRADSNACDLTVSGRIYRWSGVSDSASDTLGIPVPLPGTRIEFYFVAPLPRDSVPGDSVPRDSVPRDSVPRDSMPRDSIGDSLSLRGLFVRAAAAPDSARGGQKPVRPTATATSRGDGSYTVRGLCPGIYRYEIHEPGTMRYSFNYVVVAGDITDLNAVLSPLRR